MACCLRAYFEDQSGLKGARFCGFQLNPGFGGAEVGWWTVKRPVDVRGFIGVLGTNAIQASVLYKALSADGDDIEVWAEPSRERGWWYYWLVSQTDSYPQRLALVRYSYDLDQLQERIEGPFGQELWVDVPFK
jgi:hypothetical protein